MGKVARLHTDKQEIKIPVNSALAYKFLDDDFGSDCPTEKYDHLKFAGRHQHSKSDAFVAPLVVGGSLEGF